MSLYTETLRRYAMDDRRTGELERPDGTGEVGLEAGEAGKRLAVRFTLSARQGRIDALRFQVFGCGFTIAACAAAAELAEGMPLSEAMTLSAEAIDRKLEGLPSERSYCADLAAQALQAAVRSALGSGEVTRLVSGPGGEEQGSRVGPSHPVYRLLMDSAPGAQSPEDRHLLACLLSLASEEPWEPPRALGLAPEEFSQLFRRFFPAVLESDYRALCTGGTREPPEIAGEILDILREHQPEGGELLTRLFPRILSARLAHPGHLWCAMGLFARPEITAAIARHLPSLVKANDRKMRWKRYLFKQLCDRSGAMLCKTPNCGLCSDYALCFPAEDADTHPSPEQETRP